MFEAEGRRDNLPVIRAEHADTRKMDGSESLDNNRREWGQRCWKETRSATNSKSEVTTHIFSLWTVYVKLWPIFASTCWFWKKHFPELLIQIFVKPNLYLPQQQHVWSLYRIWPLSSQEFPAFSPRREWRPSGMEWFPRSPASDACSADCSQRLQR